jgi:AraC family ethanolamine operon transcriptional activator
LALTSIAGWRPDLLGATAARSMLKKDLLDLVARALGSSRPVASAGRPSSHSAIVLRVEEHLRASEGRAVTVTDLCGVAGATERTLRNAFSRVYGMGPNRFVRLHRLDEARRALRTPAPTDTVSRIATALGIWDLGRFAGQYRALFGESPSQTLERARRGRTASPTRRLPRRPSRRCESEDIRADDPPPP